MFPQHALDRIHRAAEHRNRTRRNTIGFELGARERRESAPVSPLAVEPYLVFDRVERRTDEGKQRRVRIAGGQVDDAIRNRLAVYQRQTAPVLDWYRQQGTGIATVDAVGSVDDVTARALDALGSLGIRGNGHRR